MAQISIQVLLSLVQKNMDNICLFSASLTAPVCCFSSSLWQDVEIRVSLKLYQLVFIILFFSFYQVNNTLLSSRSGTHHYSAFLTKAVLTSKAYIESHQVIEVLYFPDANEFNTLADTSESFKNRREMFQNSNTKRLFFRVMTPILLQQKYLVWFLST